MKKLMIVLSILLIVGSSDLHGQTQRQITSADAYRMYQQRMYEQQQQRYREQQQRFQQQQQRFREQQQRFQQQMRESQQRVRTAMMNRNRTINPYSLNEGGIGGFPMGGPVRSAPRTNQPRTSYPRPDYNYRGRYEIDMRKQQFNPIRQGGREGAGNELRERANQAERDRQDRDSYRRQNERYMDRMATRAGQTTQPQGLTERMGLGKLAPDISRKDVERLKDSYGIRDLGNNNGRSAPERSTPQRRDSSDRSRSDNSSRSGRSSPSRDTRERSAPTCSTARC